MPPSNLNDTGAVYQFPKKEGPRFIAPSPPEVILSLLPTPFPLLSPFEEIDADVRKGTPLLFFPVFFLFFFPSGVASSFFSPPLDKILLPSFVFFRAKWAV